MEQEQLKLNYNNINMKVKTTVPVNGQSLYNEIAVLEMLSIQPLKDGSVRISAEYQKEDGTPVKSVPKTYSKEQVASIYSTIASGVTKKQPSLFMWECMSKAMVVEIAQTFGINTNEVIPA